MDAPDLRSFPGRGACTDAERRASVWLHDRLRERGHEAWVETHWVRPQWAGSLLLHASLGIAASLLSSAESLVVPALAMAVVALVSYLLELSIGGGLSWLYYRRATQVVVVEPEDPDAIALLITAGVDAPRRAWAARLPVRPLWVAVLLGTIVVAGLARVAGAEGTLMGTLQFVPTLALLLVAAAAIDVATSEWSDGEPQAEAVAAAVEIHAELVERPPERLSAGLWLAGASEPFARGVRAQLRADRRRAADTVVLEVRPGGDLTWHTRHPQIRRAAESISHPEAQPRVLRRFTAAGAARRAGLPAAAVSGADPVDYCVALADALDAELSATV